jgi:Family of unknown function (DUF5946)
LKREYGKPCPGCGAVLFAVEVPTHPYMEASPACWKRYEQLLAVQYSDPARMAFHQLVVDAYAVQHPDGEDPRAVRSVAIHLMTLCLFLERGADPALGPRLHRQMVQTPMFHRLAAPTSPGRVTVVDMPVTGSAAAARDAAYAWSSSAWAAWAAHHETIRRWLVESGLGSA